MTDWATISSLATAGGTLVLAVATFSAVRSSNRSARLAERGFLAGLRPVLVPSRLDDPTEKIPFSGQHWFRLAGGHGAAKFEDDVVFLMMGVRNVGAGLAVLRGWQVRGDLPMASDAGPLPVDSFRPQLRDIYLPIGDSSFWHGALRDPDDPMRPAVLGVMERREPLTIELLYGDGEGGQRVISRFGLLPVGDEDDWLVAVSRHWNLDRDDPK